MSFKGNFYQNIFKISLIKKTMHSKIFVSKLKNQQTIIKHVNVIFFGKSLDGSTGLLIVFRHYFLAANSIKLFSSYKR
jgi:hypothetical protein